MPVTAARLRLRRLGAVVVALGLLVAMAPTAFADPPPGPGRGGDIIPGQYIVTLTGEADRGAVLASHGLLRASVTASYRAAFNGFAGRMPAAVASRLAADPRVELVEPDRRVSISATQSNATWGLDRTDQRLRPLSGTYTYPTTGRGVRTYVVDTGVRATHRDFDGRVAAGYAVPGLIGTDDCHGHGTHVAATVAGSAYGIAKAATVVPVRVLDCDGGGSASQIIAGIDWMTAAHRQGDPAVANLSLGTPQRVLSVDNAVRNAIAKGITVVAAAGNQAVDACNVSPAGVPEVLTVGASDSSDRRAAFSNTGPCLDLFAPGALITSAGISSDTATLTMSGTSMAAPHAAGAAARLLEAQPSWSPATVTAALTADATLGIVTDQGTGSTRSLLYADPEPPTISTALTQSSTQWSSVRASRKSLVFGQTVTVSGTLSTSDGKPLANRTVRLQVRREGATAWRDGPEGITRSNGEVSIPHATRWNAEYRLRYPGGTGEKASNSARRTVKVATKVTATLSSATVKRGATARLTGGVRPGHAGQEVRLQRYRDGAWRNVKSTTLNSKSNYRFSLATGTRGKFRYRVVKPADSDHIRGISPARRLTVD